MKKIISLAVAMAAFLAFSVQAFAAVASIDEYKLSMEFPDDWYVITKNSTADEEVFENYLYYEPIMEYMEEGGFEIIAVDAFGNFEFNLILSQTDDYVPLKDISNFALNTNKKDVERQWASYGYENIETDTYEGAVETFITVKYDYVLDGEKVYGLDYVGFVDGILCVFSMYSYDGLISPMDVTDMNSIVDSIISENEVPESAGTSSSSSSARFLVRNIKSIGAVIVAAVAGAFAWIKKKFGKKKNPEEAAAPAEIPNAEQTFSNEYREDDEYAESGEYHAENVGYVSEDIPQQEEKRCPECGGMITEEDKFCPLCGKKI